jgi:hypothetical protein
VSLHIKETLETHIIEELGLDKRELNELVPSDIHFEVQESLSKVIKEYSEERTGVIQ